MKPDMMVLHGFLGGAWSFEDVVRRMAPRRWLVPVLSFHGGDAPRQNSEHTFMAEVERLAQVIRDRADAPIDLAGYSMGGRLALALAIYHPELIGKLVLISSRRGLDDAAERARRRADDEKWARMVEKEGLQPFLSQWWAQPIFATMSHLDPGDLSRESSLRCAHDPAGVAMALRCFSLGVQPSFASEVRTLQTPVTLLAGARDEKFVQLSHGLAAELPRGRCRVIEGAGHHLLLEAPAETARLLEEETER